MVHSFQEGKYYAYGPYVREMNLWMRSGMELIIVAPIDKVKKPSSIDLAYKCENICFIAVPEFNLNGLHEILRTLYLLPLLIFNINKGMSLTDHIHLRCPGNMGLLGCISQIFFPHKIKTAKYAGNWDWNSKQPWSYRLQQRILRNTFLTRNMTALVYGDWPDRTKNIKPFFTASYSEYDRTEVIKPDLSICVNLAFVGTLSTNKSPLTSLLTLKELKSKGISAHLTLCGDGPEKDMLLRKAIEWDLANDVDFLGNVSAEKVKEVLRQAHFLVFISRSEGWPKAVAEAMWWGCIPITTAVSCVSQMLARGERGYLVENNMEVISGIISDSMNDSGKVKQISTLAMNWSREYTLERFESEIIKLIKQC